MAAQKQVTDNNAEMLKVKAQQKKVFIGQASVVKGLQRGTVEKVFLASNCPARMKEDITHYAALAKVPVESMAQNNEEMGIICKKNFMVSVVGLHA